MKLSLQQAIQRAKEDPNSDFAKALRTKIESGALDEVATQQGVNIGRPKAFNGRADKVREGLFGSPAKEGGTFKENLQAIGEQEVKPTPFLNEVSNDINKRVERVGDIKDRETPAFRKGVQIFGQGAGMAANILESAAMKVPVIKQVFEGFGKGIGELTKLAEDKRTPIGRFVDYISDSKTLQEVVGLYDTDQDFKDSVDAFGNSFRLAGDVQATMDAVKAVNKVSQKLADRFYAKGDLKNALKIDIKESGSEFDAIQQRGEQAFKDKIFDKGGNLIDDVSKKMVDDLVQKFNKAQPGLGDDFAKIVNTVDQTTDSIRQQAAQFTKTQGINITPTDITPAVAKTAAKEGVTAGSVSFSDLLGEFKGTKTPKVKLKPKQRAKLQGFSEPQVKFIEDMSGVDKTKALKMQDLAESASKDLKVIERPIDLVGESTVNKLKPIEQVNKTAGKAIEKEAKALKGQKVDASALGDVAFDLIDELEAFKYTPELFKKIEKFIENVPSGQVDAYQLHTFKKAIDELVSYGVAGEGLKGKAANMLKQLRKSADDILDSNFEAYNQANVDYKATIEVLNDARRLFGKQGFTDVKGGQIMRRVFSNTASRGEIMQLLKNIDEISAKYGVKTADNLIDQALFAIMLEDIYGTQAVTSFRGQIEKAVSGAQKATQILRDPIKGVGEVAATGLEKVLGISDEGKKALLKELLSN